MTIPSLGRGGLPVYSPASSTATATNASRTVTFTGTALQSVNSTTGATEYAAGVGDLFVVQGVGAKIVESVDSPTQITLTDPWSAATQSGVSNWYIIRNSVPAYGSTAKAIQDVLAIGGDTSPNTSYTIDDGTARLKARLSGGAAQIAVGPTLATDAALKAAVQIDPATGVVSFPNGMKEYALGLRNRVINGAFRIWQRGTSFSSPAGTYTADRWFTSASGGTYIVSKIAAPAGFRAPDALNIASTGTPASGFIDLNSRFEGAQLSDLEGVASTVSFDTVGATSAGSIIGTVFIITNTALDNGTFSSVATAVGFGFPATGQKVTVPIPAVTGLKNGAMLLIRIIQLSAIGNANVSYGSIQWEKGAVANDFEFRPLALELLMCQRFFEKSYALGTAPGTVTTVGQASAFMGGFPSAGTFIGANFVSYRTLKRVSPTVTFYSAATGATGKIRDAQAGADLTANIVGNGDSGFTWFAIAAGASTTLNMNCQWAADAEL